MNDGTPFYYSEEVTEEMTPGSRYSGDIQLTGSEIQLSGMSPRKNNSDAKAHPMYKPMPPSYINEFESPNFKASPFRNSDEMF